LKNGGDTSSFVRDVISVFRNLLDLNTILVQVLQNGQFYLVLKLLYCKEVSRFVRQQGGGVFGEGQEFCAHDGGRS